MKGVFRKLYTRSPQQVLQRIRARWPVFQPRLVDEQRVRALSDALRSRFDLYRMDRLHSMDKDVFGQHIQSQLNRIDGGTEGYSDDELPWQRDLSVKFHWGHHHDFGDFQLQGRMGNRHIEVLANFMALFAIELKDFEDKAVLDVGCWTGGTTLLLASLQSRVLAIEEVKKYADMTAFLCRAFGLNERVSVRATSLYECNTAEFRHRFDIVHCPGVIYHLSDPVLALRILFNSLTVGGIILLESAGINHPEPLCRFEGSRIYGYGTQEQLNRSGWNWFLPSPAALRRMMEEAGFENVRTVWHDGSGRVYGYGKKTAHTGICRAGLSVRTID